MEDTALDNSNDLWVAETVQKFFGGEKPIHISTLYRGIATGRYPRPVNVGGSRWLPDECRAARKRMIDERDSRKRRVETRGRKRREPQAANAS